jgi:hypothetical protein
MASRSWSERRRVGGLVGLLVLASSAGSGVAHAQPDGEDDLRRGVLLRREGKEAEALQAFQRALGRAPSARARAQVGLTEQALALWLLAERDLTLALADANDPWIRQNREALERASALVASKLAWLSVIAPTDAGAQLVVNGLPAARGPDGRVRVIAGQLSVELRAEGHAPTSTTVQVAPETTVAVRLDLGAPLAERDAPRSSPAARAREGEGETEPGSGRRALAWGLTGVGVVGLGLGAVFGARAITKKDERDTDCQGGCTQVGVDADRAGRTAAVVSTLAFTLGAAATVTGVVLLLTPPARRAPTGGEARRLELDLGWSSVAVRGAF